METSKNFSQKIIQDIKSYWLKKYNIELSTESAERYLFILAELYLSICKIEQEKKRKV